MTENIITKIRTATDRLEKIHKEFAIRTDTEWNVIEELDETQQIVRDIKKAIDTTEEHDIQVDLWMDECDRVIKISTGEDGHYYDIYILKDDESLATITMDETSGELRDSDDGGLCTGTLYDAIEMATS